MLKMNINVFKCENDNAIPAPLRFQIFKILKKQRIFKKISKISEISEFSRKEGKSGVGWRGTLRVLCAETWLTVYRTIAMEVFFPLEEWLVEWKYSSLSKGNDS